LTRRRISGSAGTRCVAPAAAACWGLRGSAMAGALSGTGAGSLAAFGGHAGLLCDAGLLIAGDASS
jgi:hypothetical protein